MTCVTAFFAVFFFHVQQRIGPAFLVPLRPAAYSHPHALIEAARRRILLIHRRPPETVPRLAEPEERLSDALPPRVRLEEEHFQLFPVKPHEPDGLPVRFRCHEDGHGAERLRHIAADAADLLFRQEIMGRPHGALPQRGQGAHERRRPLGRLPAAHFIFHRRFHRPSFLLSVRF